MQWWWLIIYLINLLVAIFNVRYILVYHSSHRDYIKYVEWYKKNKEKQLQLKYDESSK